MPTNRSSAVVPGQFATFGELLQYLRRRAGLTQRELSVAVGYSESQISRLEKNQRLPDAAMLPARFVPALQLDTEPEWAARLFELGGGPRPAPAASPAAPPPSNLPIPLTSFIGREAALAELEQLLAGPGAPPLARLVTLTGHGGCGKTRLALQAGAALRASFPRGVWLVELAPLTDPDYLPRTVAGALGLKDEPGHTGLAGLVDHLRPQKTLLILDNCEQVVAGAAQLAQALLQACPQVSILATSRELLGVAGERPYWVPALTTPVTDAMSSPAGLLRYEAVRLFVERAAFAAPDFALSAANAAAVVSICRQLDGIPLAIELATARLRLLPVEQIAARLDDAFRLLTSGSRTALPHHQTLQALIDWSYDLLTPPEAVLLRRLSVFHGGWTLAAAEAVCSGGESVTAAEVFELLGRLIDKSLALFVPAAGGQPARYRLLETIRQYAAAKLAASGETDAVHLRHATYYLGLAEQGAPRRLDAPTNMSWIHRLELEDANLHAALVWTLATVDAGSARRLGGNDDILTSAWALNRLGWVARERGDYPTARVRLEQSMAVYRELGDALGIAWTANTLGEVLIMQGELAAARACLEEALTLSRQLGETAATGWALNHLGHLAQREGDLAQAWELQQASLAAFRSPVPNYNGQAWALHDAGEVALAASDAARARRCFIDAIELSKPKRDGACVAWCLAGLASVAALEAASGRAAWLWGAAEALRLAVQVRPAPSDPATHQRLQAQVRQQLGPQAFAAAWAAGQSADVSQVFASLAAESPALG